MNTKTDGISSGLVAVAWSILNGVHTPIVRLSDAEALIAAKDAEIEQLSLYKNLVAEYGLSVFADMKQQAERIAELEATVAGFRLDQEEMIANEVKQSAALKLASLALSEGVEYVEEPPEKNCTCHLSPPCNDCVDHSAVREFFIDARKALAAIDALGE